jgi:hypothetical protein
VTLPCPGPTQAFTNPAAFGLIASTFPEVCVLCLLSCVLCYIYIYIYIYIYVCMYGSARVCLYVLLVGFPD